jgi:hypothetical protein
MAESREADLHAYVRELGRYDGLRGDETVFLVAMAIEHLDRAVALRILSFVAESGNGLARDYAAVVVKNLGRET